MAESLPTRTDRAAVLFPPDTATFDYPADLVKRSPEPLRVPLDQRVRFIGIGRQQQAVVLSARYGQFDRRTSRYALDGNLRSGPRSLQYMSQIRSQPVGKVHHRSDGPLLSEPSAFAHVRFRVEMSRDELRSGPAFPKIG